MADLPTADPHVFIEEKRLGYVRYRSDDGRRWEVTGTCIRLGNCLVGAVIKDFGQIKTLADIEQAKLQLGVSRIDSDMDVPVGPGFKGCCDLRTQVL
jgi:hypothetical protein